MAQLLLTAGSALGSVTTKAGIGAFVARTVATTAASYVSRLVFGPQKRTVEGPRLDGFQIQASQEGASMLRVYGRARIAGQLIWAANFKETVSETTQSSGGKGAAATVETTQIDYAYSISFAVGLCEGIINRIGRVWADGKLIDLSKINTRLYHGTQSQNPDALIVTMEGADTAPAFRGLAYLVFEDLPLRDFGNRIPQLSFEVEKSLATSDPGALENQLTAVTMIPGSGEFVYGTTGITRDIREGVTASENIHNNQGTTDFVAALDALLDIAPNLGHVSLVVSWFGNSLDAGACQLRPGVEGLTKTTAPFNWSVGGVDRTGAHLVSTIEGAPAYGGTPADSSVIEAIRALKARGLKVMLHPFILMDHPGFPWRGRINLREHDKTPAATQDVAAFFGAARPSDFTITHNQVAYHGPDEWSFRRMLLHYAHLCVVAGGIDGFLLGSELRGLTTARDAANHFPAVAQLKSLAADVRTVLGHATDISYGADWSEYFGHQPADGSGDVYFHLDDLWGDDDIDFIGIDNYMPLADWRDGFAHLDAIDGASSQYDVGYLQSNIKGGEGFDWYYASQADRDGQHRTPIRDGRYDEAWVFRYKDLWHWWSHPHHHRPGGVRQANATQWVPMSKPIVFTEIGAPAVDKAANQPNLFIDPKSTESALPHYSTGNRDDLAQRKLLEAQAGFWRDANNNPMSPVYNGPMVDTARSYVYAYDARPFPDFPSRADIWGDAGNWEKGHWLNGRLGRAPLALLVAALAREVGFTAIDTTRLQGIVSGYVVDRPMSPREAIDPLAEVYQFDMVESADVIRFQPRHGQSVVTIDQEDLTARDNGAFSLSRAQESDLPSGFRLGFFDEEKAFAASAVEARDPGAAPAREIGTDIAAVIPAAEAAARARSILADAWVMREKLSLTLPPSALDVEPGDTLVLTALNPDQTALDRRYRITEIDDASDRQTELVRLSPAVYDAPVGASIFTPPTDVPVFAPPIWTLFELPLLRDEDDGAAPWLASFADPWPGGVALYRQAGASSPSLVGMARTRSVMGRLTSPLPSGASGRWDHRHVDLRLSFGTLAARNAEDVLAGANVLAVESHDGGFEVLQFQRAQLRENGDWRVSVLLRGQGGSEAEAVIGAPKGARVVLLSPAVTQINFPIDLRGLSIDWQAGPVDDIPDTANFSKKTLRFSGRGLMPLSPVHLRTRKIGEDRQLSWIRRTRLNGDSWEGEVPVSERVERYAVRIFDGDTELRRVETDRPTYIYRADEILNDFGTGGPGLDAVFSVAQISDVVGEGYVASHKIM